jgi:hypothetical protein
MKRNFFVVFGILGMSLVAGCTTVSETAVTEMSDIQLCQGQESFQPPNTVGRIAIGVITLGVSEFAEMQRRQDRRVFDQALRARGVSSCD